jgi:signal transduction histidine kinase
MPLARGSVAGDSSKLWSLLEAGITLADEVSIDGILERILETAATLTGARYAALGVIDETGRQLERFLTTGLDAEATARIGAAPTGRGILGLLIQEPKPLRLVRIGDDPRSVGFPPGHPPMTSFLGVPMMIQGSAYGNLYLTDKDGGEEFTDEDEELVVMLARQAAVAVANARLYRTARVWAHQLEAVGELTDSLLGETRSESLATLVVDQFRAAVMAEGAVISLVDADGSFRVAAAEGRGAAYALEFNPEPPARYLRVLSRGGSVRVDSLATDPDVDPAAVRAMGVSTALLTPLTSGDRMVGFLVAWDRVGTSRFTDSDQRLAEIFAARAASILELSRRVRRETVESILEAQEQERRRVGLELHDQTGQELTATLLGLKRLDAVVSDNPAAREEIASLRELITGSILGVRRLSTMLSPPPLDKHGLTASIARLGDLFGDRSGIAITVSAEVDDSILPDLVAGMLYRIAQEGLTNVVRHADATAAGVRLEPIGRNRIVLTIEDNGIGIPDGVLYGVGLAGIRERANLLGGDLSIGSRPGAGTRLTVEVPLG